jgi:hypothetical protein
MAWMQWCHALLDKWWRQAFSALTRNVPEGARVLLPVGDWPQMPYATTFYRSRDCNIDIIGHDAIFIHKGMLASFRQGDIGLCLKDMTAVCANAVFVLFVQKPRARRLFLPAHLDHLKIYADPARFRRRRASRGAFMHIPKTGGTSIWKRVSKAVRSNMYFSSDHTLAAFEGDINAFEVVGGHFSAETLVRKGWQGPVFFVLRNPIERVLSAIAHAHRLNENLAQFDDSYHAMRRIGEGPLDSALRNLLFYEGNMQVRMLGELPGDDLYDPASRALQSARAFERLASPGWSFGVLEDPDRLARQVSAQFGLRDAGLPHVNRTVQSSHPSFARQVCDFLYGEGATCMDLELHKAAIARNR